MLASCKRVLASASAVVWSLPILAGTCTCTFEWFRNNAVANFQVPLALEEGRSGFSYRGTAADGSDLRISDGTANLPYEIENWNPSGKSIVWVKVPSFSCATTLTLRWGEEAQSIAPAEAERFWDEAFAVVHFGGETAVNAVNNDALTGTATHEDSLLGQGVALNKAGSLVKTGSDGLAYAATTNQFTISFWIKTDALRGGPSADGTYLLQWGPKDGQHAVLLNWNSDQDGVFSFYNLKNVTGYLPSDTSMKLPDSAWHHIAFTYDGTTFTAYRDGFVMLSKPLSGFSYLPVPTKESYLAIGGTVSGSHAFRGSLEEVRFENACRGADWIRAAVETQSREVPGGSAQISFADYSGDPIANFPAYIQVDANTGIRPEAFHQSLLRGTAHVRDRRTGALLPIEIEHAFFNAFDNTLGFWALMPRYSAEDGLLLTTSFDCYAPVSSDAEINPMGPAGVWNDEDYLMVFHMNPTGLLHDVVHNVRLAANCRGADNRLGGFPVATDGPTGPYGAYRSTTNAVQRNSGGVAIPHAFTNVFTISWWMKEDADEYAAPKPETYVWNVFGTCALKGAGYSGHGAGDNQIALYPNMKEAKMVVPDAGWHHYAYASDGKKTYCYRDGELVTTTTQVKNFGFSSGVSGQSVMLMSSSNPVKDAFRGCGDEFRVETVCRDATWIKACYLNQLAWRNGTPWQLVPHFAKVVDGAVVAGRLQAAATLSCRTNATVTLFWGTADGGQYPNYWADSVSLGEQADGVVAAQIELPSAGGRLAYRFRAVNAHGTAWSDVRYVENLPQGKARVYEFKVAYEGTETLKDFPLCVRIPAAVELPADKEQVRFVDDAGQVLAWEAELWEPEGERVVWVRLPELVKGTVVRLEFRSDWSAAGDWSAAETWDAESFAGVYHFAPGTTVVSRDSSATANDLTQNSSKATVTNGVAGPAFYWSGTISGVTKSIDSGRPFCDFRQGFTFSCWARMPDDSTARDQWLVKHELRDKDDIAANYYCQYVIRYDVSQNRSVEFYLYELNGQFTPYGLTFGGLGLSDGGCSPFSQTASAPLASICRAACPDDGWHQYVFTHDGLFLRAYLDGVQVNQAFWPFVLNAGVLGHKQMTTNFGNNVNQYNRACGALDEYRAERVGRSAAWIKACYDNQKPDSDFVTLGRVIIPALTVILR